MDILTIAHLIRNLGKLLKESEREKEKEALSVRIDELVERLKHGDC